MKLKISLVSISPSNNHTLRCQKFFNGFIVIIMVIDCCIIVHSCRALAKKAITIDVDFKCI